MVESKMRTGCIKIGGRDRIEEISAREVERSDRRRTRLRGGALLLLSLSLGLLACRLDGDRKVAERILDRYHGASGAKPLPASHVIRMRLSPETAGGGVGLSEIAWEPNRFRERVSSAGVTTERGIQSGKAYFTDEDGVTRVASEPVLRELLSRSYFWRRGWLFTDRERARLTLGPADPSSVSVRLEPFGANPVLLRFSRADGRLLAVRSPRFDLDFAAIRSFREASGRHPPVRVAIAWEGLPTGRIPDASVGGECGRFRPASGLIPFERTPDGGISFPARVNGVSLRLAFDATVDGPLAISAAKAGELALSPSRDVYGRSIAAGGTLEAGGFSCSGIHLEVLPNPPEGSDGVVGGTVLREAVVELDAKSGSLSLHDPARWVSPAGFHRILVDDDGNRPVTTLRKKAAEMRVIAGSATRLDLTISPAAAARLEIRLPGDVPGLRWGALALPPVSAAPERTLAGTDWGEDGRLGLEFLLRFHVYFDMPHRWLYVRPTER